MRGRESGGGGRKGGSDQGERVQGGYIPHYKYKLFTWQHVTCICPLKVVILKDYNIITLC